ncbi:MAG: hypothetical protein KC416_17340, partial [Myxococcales bacterium]|nr:hypothetical protein [Myxococcales bacterium]
MGEGHDPITSSHWMAKLAAHYAETSAKHPQARLLLVSDIDGTILDMRHMVLSVLRAYDRKHGKRHFARLQLRDIHVHENNVERLL